MKKRLLIVLLAVATIIGSMAGIASAVDTFQRLDGTIDYEAMKTITTDMTYRDLARILLEKNDAAYTSSPAATTGGDEYLAEFLNPLFETEYPGYGESTVEYNIDDLDVHKEDYVGDDYNYDFYAILDRKLDADTIIKYGYVIGFDTDLTTHIDQLKTYINGTEVEWHEYPEDWAGALASEYKVAIETYNTDPYAFYAYFYVGSVGDVIYTAPTKKGADTSDSSDIALFGMLAVIALAGVGFAAKKKLN